jgi:hypothetical protein
MNDFDFLIGEWTIANRRLRERLVGSDEWEEFASTSVVHNLFDGAANLDEITFPSKGFKGMTLRLFDPERQKWSLYWANSQTAVLFPPVVGRFEGGRGEFYGDDAEGGTPVRVRYIWSDITPTSAHWEQAFSTDQGKTWETNWIMELTRPTRRVSRHQAKATRSPG